jgi:hypothetical protein
VDLCARQSLAGCARSDEAFTPRPPPRRPGARALFRKAKKEEIPVSISLWQQGDGRAASAAKPLSPRSLCHHSRPRTALARKRRYAEYRLQARTARSVLTARRARVIGTNRTLTARPWMPQLTLPPAPQGGTARSDDRAEKIVSRQLNSIKNY